eukprot:scaffold1287_cov253-Ochromonas_danica.AAC.12
MGKLRPGQTTTTTATTATTSVLREDQVTVTAAAADTTGKLGVIHYPEGISAALAARHHTMISASSISDNSDRQQSMSTEEGTPYTFTFDDTLPYIAPNGSIFTSREIRKDGYTAAGFSGRMPMAELADAIIVSLYIFLDVHYKKHL